MFLTLEVNHLFSSGREHPAFFGGYEEKKFGFPPQSFSLFLTLIIPYLFFHSRRKASYFFRRYGGKSSFFLHGSFFLTPRSQSSLLIRKKASYFFRRYGGKSSFFLHGSFFLTPRSQPSLLIRSKYPTFFGGMEQTVRFSSTEFFPCFYL